MTQLLLKGHSDFPYLTQNQNDIVFTPDNIARFIVEYFKPVGKCLDPCMGEGAFFKYLPSGSDWCEITRGRNFFSYNNHVDWIVSNPPYSQFNEWLEHSFSLAQNIIYLLPFAKVFKSWGTLMVIKKFGGIKEVVCFKGGDCGFPFGFPVGAFHFKQHWNDATSIRFYGERHLTNHSSGH